MDYGDFKELSAYYAEERAGCRVAATEDFGSSQRRAAGSGLKLVRHSEVHYQLSSLKRGWLINVYPGNHRLYVDKNRSRAPYLRVPMGWSLEDVVTAAIVATKGERS